MHITLLDLDPGAIEFAREQLEPLLSANQLTAASACALVASGKTPPLETAARIGQTKNRNRIVGLIHAMPSPH